MDSDWNAIIVCESALAIVKITLLIFCNPLFSHLPFKNTPEDEKLNKINCSQDY